MRSSWKAALISRPVFAAVLICSAALPAAAGTGPAQVVGDTTASARPLVSKVRWEGLEMLDRGALTRSSYLVTGAVLSDSLLRLEFARVDSVCFSAGLLAAEASIDTVMRGATTEVTVRISEGVITTVGRVTVSASEVIPEDEIPARLGVEPGSPFDPVALERSMTDLLAYLNRSGYPFAQVWMTGFEFFPETGTVDLTFAVYGGEEAVVSSVVFEGLTKTDTTLAVRTSRLRTGRPYDEAALERAPRYLSGSGLFAKVGDPAVSRTGEKSVGITIPVEEKKKGNSIQGIFGFAKKETEGYVTNGSVDLALRNIGGTGRDVDFRWLDDGLSFRTMKFGYSEDFFFSLPAGLDAELRQDVYDTLYDYTLAGFDARFSTGPSSGIVAGYTWDNNVPQEDPVLKRSVRHRFRAGADAKWPGRGDLSLRVEGAFRTEYLSGATKRANQLIYAFSGQAELPAFAGQSVYMRLVSEGIFSKDDVKAAETYPLGGARSLRGYRENQFRGEKIAWANLEYRFGGESRIFLFYDAGAYYREDTGWQVLDGLGFGLMSSSSLGTVSLSFGMGERVALDGMLIHISLIENF